MLTWLSVMLEKIQNSLAVAKEWLDTKSNFKNREIVLGGAAAVIALLLALLI